MPPVLALGKRTTPPAIPTLIEWEAIADRHQYRDVNRIRTSSRYLNHLLHPLPDPVPHLHK